MNTRIFQLLATACLIFYIVFSIFEGFGFDSWPHRIAIIGLGISMYLYNQAKKKEDANK